MKCRRAKGLIYDFIDGIIDDSNRIALEQHLGECKSCEDLSTGLSRSLELLHRAPLAEPDENFTWKVRLRLARERNALSDRTVPERSWVRSWNRRFALSALSAFVVVLGTTYFATKSSLLPTTTEPLSQLVQPKPKDSAGPAANTPVEPKVPGRADELFDFPFSTAEPVRVGTDGGGGSSGVGGALEEDKGPLLDLDSLRNRYRQSSLKTHRLRSLRDQVDLLTSELRECGERCGDGQHEKHESGEK
ncbi:MAG: zf-HC2 domain-containing protein [Candidatus Krumholzibacteria bacterium]